MSNDNNGLKNNAPCEEKQDARELTPDELAKVNGGGAYRHIAQIIGDANVGDKLAVAGMATVNDSVDGPAAIR